MSKRKRRIEGSAPAPEPQVRSAQDAEVDPSAPTTSWRPPSSTGFPWPPLVLIGAVVAVSLIVVSIRAANSTPKPSARVIENPAYIAAINATCKEAFPDLRPATPDRDAIVTPADVKEKVLRATAGIAGLATRIRTIDAPPGDAAAVRGWLSDWDQYVVIGRSYADLVETDVKRADAIGRSGDGAQKRADQFATGNGLNECTFAVRFKAPPRQPGSI